MVWAPKRYYDRAERSSRLVGGDGVIVPARILWGFTSVRVHRSTWRPSCVPHLQCIPPPGRLSLPKERSRMNAMVSSLSRRHVPSISSDCPCHWCSNNLAELPRQAQFFKWKQWIPNPHDGARFLVMSLHGRSTMELRRGPCILSCLGILCLWRTGSVQARRRYTACKCCLPVCSSRLDLAAFIRLYDGGILHDRHGHWGPEEPAEQLKDFNVFDCR